MAPPDRGAVRLAGVVALALLPACGDGGTNPTTTLDCDGVGLTTLGVGEYRTVDATLQAGCLRLPQAGAGGAEYLVVGYSAAGQETPTGVAQRFTLQATTDGFSAGQNSSTRREAPGRAGPDAFHAMLRARERRLAEAWGTRPVRISGAQTKAPPVPGSHRDFKVCETVTCASAATVAATVMFVGAHSAIYLDDTVPAGGYAQTDLDSIGMLFDEHIYPIDTTAFGRESDIDGNGIVLLLLTDRVNALSPNCTQTASYIPGYFLGQDLSSHPNSNGGEVLYGVVPDPAIPVCFAKAASKERLAVTLIHELQHMISFNHHVLRSGGPAEETWLNEGMSHFAEELGGRGVPGAFCRNQNCLNQFMVPPSGGNLRNGFDYLTSPEEFYLIEPGTSTGTFEERGANWLFVRWLADRSPTDALLGADITRRLSGADLPGGITLTGGANVAAAGGLFEPGVGFATLLGQWHLANYAEALPGFSEPSQRVSYRTWNLAAAFNQVFFGPYPLRPDSTSGVSPYRVTGTLRGGSGAYLRVIQQADGPAVAVGLTVRQNGAVIPRYAVLRLR